MHRTSLRCCLYQAFDIRQLHNHMTYDNFPAYPRSKKLHYENFDVDPSVHPLRNSLDRSRRTALFSFAVDS